MGFRSRPSRVHAALTTVALIALPSATLAALWQPALFETTVSVSANGVVDAQQVTDTCFPNLLGGVTCPETPTGASLTAGGYSGSVTARGASSSLRYDVYTDLGGFTGDDRLRVDLVEYGLFARDPVTTGANSVRVSAYFPTIDLFAAFAPNSELRYEIGIGFDLAPDDLDRTYGFAPLTDIFDVTTAGTYAIDAAGNGSFHPEGIDVGAVVSPTGVLVRNFYVDETLATVSGADDYFSVLLYKSLTFERSTAATQFVEGADAELVDPFLVNPGDQPEFSLRNILQIEAAPGAAVPLPATLLLVATGLGGLHLLRRPRRAEHAAR